jgi:predicted secreted protein
MSIRRLGEGIAIAALALLTGVLPALGESEDARNRVSFRVESSREVENDWVSAVIGVTHEDTDPARLADRINVDMSWALETAQARQGLRVRSGGYRTFPVEDPKRAQLRRWRGSQDLIVEGADAKLVSDLLGELQSRLQLRSIVFRISPERMRAVEAELVDEALDAFRARAEGVRTKLGARGYEIVQIRVETPGGPPVRPMPMRAMAMAEASVAPPALEGGTSTLRVGANATIELEF